VLEAAMLEAAMLEAAMLEAAMLEAAVREVPVLDAVVSEVGGVEPDDLLPPVKLSGGAPLGEVASEFTG